MNLNAKPNQSQFELDEMKCKDSTSLQFSANASLSNGEEIVKVPYSGTYTVAPHPDVFSLLKKLKEYLAQDFGYAHMIELVKGSQFSASEHQLGLAKARMESLLSDLKVNGVSVISSKKAGRTGIVVKGTYNGRAINTRTLYFSNDEYGKDIEDICNDLEYEVYQYRFEGKQAQLEAVFPGQDEEETDGKSKAAGE